MKKIISLLILTLIVILPLEVKAMNVDKNNLTLEKGASETINLSVTLEQEVTEISFTLVYTSNDIKANFNVASGLTETINNSTHKVTLSEPMNGTISLGTVKITLVDTPTDKAGKINIYNAKAVTTEGETINLTTQSINVTIENKTEDNNEETPDENNTETKPNEENKQEETPKPETQKKEENKKTENNKKQEEQQTENNIEKTEENKDEKKEIIHLLEKIESNIVKIELQDKVFEYTVKIKEEIEELDLNPIVKDSKTKVEISSQKISELIDNKIIITVKKENETQEYKINVKIMKIDEIEIDDSKFESTYTYKGKWIVAIIILSVTLFVGLLLSKKK